MLIAMAFTTICLVGTLLQKRNFRKYIQKNEDIKGDLHALHYHKSLRRWYSIFLTMISVFPLLGMLGTVVGLLGLDLTSGDMENIKANFFIALTSTAWGIILSVSFKIVNAFISDDVEEKIELAKNMGEEQYR